MGGHPAHVVVPLAAGGPDQPHVPVAQQVPQPVPPGGDLGGLVPVKLNVLVGVKPESKFEFTSGPQISYFSNLLTTTRTKEPPDSGPVQICQEFLKFLQVRFGKSPPVTPSFPQQSLMQLACSWLNGANQG